MRPLSPRARGAVAVVAVVGLAGALWWSVGRTETLLAASRTHTAYAAGDWEGAVAASESLALLPEGDTEVLGALEVRCLALARLQRKAECFALLDARILDADAATWVPGHDIAMAWADDAAARGRIADAATVADRGRRAFPTDGRWAERAVLWRLNVEDAAGVLAEAPGWLDQIEPERANSLRIRIANEQIASGDPAGALRTLGEAVPPQSTRKQSVNWLESKLAAAVSLGDQPLARKVADDWAANGGDPVAADATYAVAISNGSVIDPTADWVTLLTRSADRVSELKEDWLARQVYRRLVAHLMVEGRAEEALRYAQQANAINPDFVANTDELLRLAAAGEREGSEGGGQPLRFSIPEPVAGATLWLSPDRAIAVDGAWEAVPMSPTGAGEARREVGFAPNRWVYRSDTETFASGTVWPGLDRPANVVISTGTGMVRQKADDLRPRPEADGRRRVWLVVLDCGDWKLTSYLRQRGEMPILHALLTQGWRAGLLQNPPITAAAMTALTRPARLQSATFMATVDQLGIELGGLSSIGRNPFEPLEGLLPEAGDLVRELGAGDLRIGNMLFAHGAVKAGRNAEVTGPGGKRETLEVGAARRALSDAEIAAQPRLNLKELEEAHVAKLVEVGAAQFDAVARLVGQAELDLLLFRLETLDLATHTSYARIAESGQDDGASALLDYYRYIDLRLGEVARSMDSDDMLIVMSDHGIRTSMEHDPIAMFVAWGNGVPRGQFTQFRPPLMSVAATIARLLGVSTNWPDSNFVPWAEAWHAGNTPPGLGVPWQPPE